MKGKNKIDERKQAMAIPKNMVGDKFDESDNNKCACRIERPFAYTLGRAAEARQGSLDWICDVGPGTTMRSFQKSGANCPFRTLEPRANEKIETTNTPMPSHLCMRYILSRPPSCCSGHLGRSERIIMIAIAAIARTPVNCTISFRMAKKRLSEKTSELSANQKRVRITQKPQKRFRFNLFIICLSRKLSWRLTFVVCSCRGDASET